MTKHTTTTYLQVVPEYYTSGAIYRLKVVKATQRQPIEPDPYARIVKVNLTLDDALFAVLPLDIAVESTEMNPIGRAEVD